MSPTLLVATRGWDPESWAERIRPLLPEHSIFCTDRTGIFSGPDEALSDVAYVLAWKPQQETLDRLSALRVIFSLGAGVDHLLALPRLPDRPIARMVDPDLTGRMVEYVVWQVLHHLRRGAHYARVQAESTWGPMEQPAAREVTVGFMGLGEMGANCAAAVGRLGFPLRGWSRTPRAREGVETFSGPAEFDAFLAGTDILVALLPLTPETTGILNAALLRKLRRDGPLGGPVLINAGRGGSQNEADIASALHDGTLAGASLDVFEHEPLPKTSPLWQAPNLVITPHVAAVSDAASLAGQIAEQISAFERGEPLKNLVDRARGY